MLDVFNSASAYLVEISAEFTVIFLAVAAIAGLGVTLLAHLSEEDLD